MGLSSYLGAKATLGKAPSNMPVPRIPFPELGYGGCLQWARLSPPCLRMGFGLPTPAKPTTIDPRGHRVLHGRSWIEPKFFPR